MSLKNADIIILVLLKLIACLVYPLYNVITFSYLPIHFEQYYDKLKMT